MIQLKFEFHSKRITFFYIQIICKYRINVKI